MKDISLINEIKESYLKYIDNFKFKEKYITDKAPLNFRWIGFIEFLFLSQKLFIAPVTQKIIVYLCLKISLKVV